ncbi:hypothetical protein ICE17_004886 [Salmonella enterica subsp. enterica serovar Bredeney]|nr:hypothetical protein [Salmonella enterica subsp. enterica serovar Bredeney]
MYSYDKQTTRAPGSRRFPLQDFLPVMELAALHCIPEIKTVFSGEILQTAKDLFFNKTKKQKKKTKSAINQKEGVYAGTAEISGL